MASPGIMTAPLILAGDHPRSPASPTSGSTGRPPGNRQGRTPSATGAPQEHWQHRAACATADPALFDADETPTRQRFNQAVGYCLGCPVLAACRAAIRTDDYGIRAGMWIVNGTPTALPARRRRGMTHTVPVTAEVRALHAAWVRGEHTDDTRRGELEYQQARYQREPKYCPGCGQRVRALATYCDDGPCRRDARRATWRAKARASRNAYRTGDGMPEASR